MTAASTLRDAATRLREAATVRGLQCFWEKVDDSAGPEKCWLWTAHTSDGGYGRFTFDGHTTVAHRLAYEALVGAIPEGLVLDHLCRVRNCVNPAHLEPVTTRENNLRAFGWAGINARKVRCPKGYEYFINSQGNRECRTCSLARRRIVEARRIRCDICGSEISAGNASRHRHNCHGGVATFTSLARSILRETGGES